MSKSFAAFYNPVIGGGFSMTFKTGFTVSVSFNRLAKCSEVEHFDHAKGAGANLAEVLVCDAKGNYVLFDGGTIYQPCHPFLTAEEVLDIMQRAAEGRL